MRSRGSTEPSPRRGADCRGADRQVGGEAPDDLVGEEGVRVVHDLLSVGQLVQPVDRLLEVRRQHRHVGDGGLAPLGHGGLETLERGGEVTGGLGEHRLDLPGKRSGLPQQLAMPLALRLGRVVDQQHDLEARVLLEGGGEQRVADDARVLLVGGDDHRERRRGAVEELVEAGPGHAPVGPAAVEEAEAAHQVGDGGAGQRRHDEEVEDRLDLVAGVPGLTLDELPREPGPEVERPAHDRRHDGHAAHRDPPVADRDGDRRQRLLPPVPAPLAPDAGSAAPLFLHDSSAKAFIRHLANCCTVISNRCSRCDCAGL